MFHVTQQALTTSLETVYFVIDCDLTSSASLLQKFLITAVLLSSQLQPVVVVVFPLCYSSTVFPVLILSNIIL